MQIITHLKKLISPKPKIIVVLGQTATGKSDLAVELAQQFNGEVISADSRQVYRGLDLASGKITHEEMKGIPHYMLDLTNPKNTYTVAQYTQTAQKYILDILARNKVPIICGGTGFYIDALVYNQKFPKCTVSPELQKELNKLSTEQLYERLKQQNKKRAKEVGEHNRVRIVRSLELIETLGHMPKVKKKQPYRPLFIGLTLPPEDLKQRIFNRIVNRLDKGMIEEIQDLYQNGLSFERLYDLGLECRNIALYLKNQLTMEEMIDKLYRETVQFAKRQRTWFKRNKNIHWFDPRTDQEQVKKQTYDFLK